MQYYRTELKKVITKRSTHYYKKVCDKWQRISWEHWMEFHRYCDKWENVWNDNIDGSLYCYCTSMRKVFK